jgi:osmotically-inducible protein OsmY
LTRVAFELPTLQATVRGNVVTLTGIVDERRQKHAVVFAIRHIEDVAWVEDRIIVREHTLHTSIRSAVGRRDELDADAIHVRVCGGEVWISGTSSSMARDHAARVLLAAPGVDVVHDEVTITEPVGPMALSAQDRGAHDCR